MARTTGPISRVEGSHKSRSARQRLMDIARKMAVLSNLNESIRFQKTEIEKLKQEVLGEDRKSHSRYIRDFIEEFRDYESACSQEDLYTRALESRLILVGDFHALPASQEFAANLLSELAKRGAPLCLGVEMLYGRNQKAVDEWTSGVISENVFLDRIRYEMEWGYDWTSFKRLFQTAREYHIPIFGVDCDPRTDLRLIGKRDACVASKLVSLLRQNPKRQIIALFGESHLASGHLPQKISELAEHQDLLVDPLVILQNVDEIYWKLLRHSQEHEVAVKVNDSVYCVFNSTPFEKYEAYRQTLEKWRAEQAGDGGEIYVTATVYNLINTLLDFIKIDKFTYCLNEQETCIEFMIDGYPEVYTHEEVSLFKKLLRNAKIPRRQIKQILDHAERRGSCYVPPVNAIFIGQFDLVPGAEEAAHFVNFACKDERREKFRSGLISSDDLFYRTVMEEALAYLGSKIITPTRNCGRESPFLRFEANEQSPSNASHIPGQFSARPEDLGLDEKDFDFVRTFLLAHLNLETNYKKMSRIPKVISLGIRCRGRKQHWIVHELGYLLGERLHIAYLAGRITRTEISNLFFEKFDFPGSALGMYLDLVARCRHA